MLGRSPRRSRHVSIFNVLVLLLVIAPAWFGSLFLYENILAANESPHDAIPDGAAGIVKVLENKGITFHGRDSMNIMVLGLDLNWTDNNDLPYSKGARSDTMFVLHLDKDGTRVGMLTVPRDMYIDLPENNGHDKINGAYSLGRERLARKTLEMFLGIHIDHYITLRIAGAKKLIDAIGGLDVNVEKTMNYDDNWGNLHVHLKKGPQHLDGTQTVAYARFRHDEESDFGRIRRQQQVVDLLIKKLKDPANFANPAELQKMAGIFKEYVTTDLNVPQMLDLGMVYEHFDRKNFVKGFIPGNDGFVGDMSVLYPPDRQTIRSIVHKLLTDPNAGLDPADVTIEVLNGSTVHMGATALGTKLTARGYNVVRLDDYAGTPPATSMIILHSKAVLPDDAPSASPSASASPAESPSALPSVSPSASASASSSPSAPAKLNAVAAKLVPGLGVIDESEFPEIASQHTPKGTMITIVLGPDWQNPHPKPVVVVPSEVPRATVTLDPPTR